MPESTPASSDAILQRNTPDSSNGPQEESLRDLVRILRKRQILIVISLAIGLMLGLLVCLAMKPRYTASATLLVDKDSGGLDVGNLSGFASALTGESDVKTDLSTHASVIAGNSNVLQVADQLNLRRQSPFAYKPFLRSNPRLIAEDNLPLDQAPRTQSRIIKIFAKKLKVTPKENTRLIDISYMDTDPVRAAQVANLLAKNYISHYLSSKYQSTAEASTWLSKQLDDLKNNVETSQHALADFEKKSGVSGLLLGSAAGDSKSTNLQIPAIDKLAQINTELTSAEANRIAKEAIYRLTLSESPDVVLGLGSSGLLSVGSASAVTDQGGGLATLTGLRNQQGALKTTLADVSTKYGDRYPRVIELQAQLKEINHQIDVELGRIRQRAKTDLNLAGAMESSLQQAFQRQQAEVNVFNDNANELEILLSRAKSSRELYQTLYTRLQEVTVQSGLQATNLNLVEPARIPIDATAPNWMLYPIIGLGAGLFAGIAIAFVWENLDDTLATPEQVEANTSFSVLGFVPRFSASDNISVDSRDVVRSSPLLSAPRSPLAESYRALRTSILLSSTKRKNTLLITSPMGGDGKSTTVYNLAISFAQHGERVLVIDADMRKPRLYKTFHSPKAPGLSEVIAGVASLEQALRPHPVVGNLEFLPAGTIPPSPSDLLDSQGFLSTLQNAREIFDVILIDSPPALLVTDPIVISEQVDGVILVVRSGVTSRRMLSRISKLMALTHSRKVGLVMNSVDTSSAEYYYSYGYYGAEGYFEEEEKVV